MTNRTAGFTLVEALVGLAVLAISFLALMMLQQSTIAADSTSETRSIAQRLAETELSAHLATTASAAGTCITQSNIDHSNVGRDDAAFYTCDTHLASCAINSNPDILLECTPAAPNPTHDLISVRVITPHGESVTLSGLRSRDP